MTVTEKERHMIEIYRKLDKNRNKCIELKAKIWMFNTKEHFTIQPADNRNKIYSELSVIERNISYLIWEIAELTKLKPTTSEINHIDFRMNKLIEKHENNKTNAYAFYNIIIPSRY